MNKKYEQCKFKIENEILEYTLNYSKRKSLEIKIKTNGQIQVSAPFYVTKKEIEAFIYKKFSWIIEKLLNVKNLNIQNEELFERESVLFFGEIIPIKYTESNIKKSRTLLNGNTLEIQLPYGFNNTDKNILIRETLKKFYSRNTLDYLEKKIRVFEDIIGVKADKIRVKDQKSRWGSCSSKKNLNFNLRLAMMPETVIDYIIIHELCHMKEMNHSKKFWDLVKVYYPEYEVAKEWVRVNTANLMFI